MGLIKKPSQIEPKKATAMLIYGQPGMGKTTLALSAEAPILVDFDGGVNRVHAGHVKDTIQIANWGEWKQALQEIKEAGCYRTIVIDTIGKMLDMVVQYIKATQPRMVQNDGTLSQKGYGVRKNVFSEFIKEVLATGIDVIFVGHEKEEKSNGDIVVKRCDAGSQTNANDLFKDLELVGYLSAEGNKRIIDFKGSDIIFAKAPTAMQKKYEIPVVVNQAGDMVGTNNFVCGTIMKDYHDFQNRNKQMTADYDNLCNEITAKVAKITDAKTAGEFQGWCKTATHIFNSKMVAGGALMKRAGELGLVFDKNTKTFSDPVREEKKIKSKKSAKAEETPEESTNENGENNEQA